MGPGHQLSIGLAPQPLQPVTHLPTSALQLLFQVYDGEEPVHDSTLNGGSLRGDSADGAAPMPQRFEGLLSRVQVSNGK